MYHLVNVRGRGVLLFILGGFFFSFLFFSTHFSSYPFWSIHVLECPHSEGCVSYV